MKHTGLAAIHWTGCNTVSANTNLRYEPFHDVQHSYSSAHNTPQKDGQHADKVALSEENTFARRNGNSATHTLYTSHPAGWQSLVGGRAQNPNPPLTLSDPSPMSMSKPRPALRRRRAPQHLPAHRLAVSTAAQFSRTPSEAGPWRLQGAKPCTQARGPRLAAAARTLRATQLLKHALKNADLTVTKPLCFILVVVHAARSRTHSASQRPTFHIHVRSSRAAAHSRACGSLRGWP